MAEHHRDLPGNTVADSTGWRRGALSGGVAALVGSAVMLWMARVTGGSLLPQVLADRLIDLTPLSIFREVLSILETNTRPVALALLIAGQVLAGAIIGVLYVRMWRWGRTYGALSLGIATWLLMATLVTPAAGSGFLAQDTPDQSATLLVYACFAAVFGSGVALFSVPSTTVQLDPSRRSLLRAGGTFLLILPGVLSAGYIGRHLERMRPGVDTNLGKREQDSSGEFSFAGMPLEITPVEAFYVVSKNFIDPRVDASNWSLEIGGLVERPMSLSYTDMLKHESREFAATLECISNEVGGDYISNAIWQGFPLSLLLDEAGLLPGIVDLEIQAADGYVESIPIDKAMDDVMVVHTMNGEPLDDKHGYPVRLIVPGIYGKKNVKWVAALNAVPEDIKGYWQVRGWSDTAHILTMSRIDVPEKARKVPIGETLHTGGIAFAGDRGISKVEVSFDRGSSWQEARLSEQLSPNAWRLWRADFVATEPGIKRIIVRATDGHGDTQDRTFREPLPEGSTGWHEDWFEVV